MIQAPKGTRDVVGEEMVLWHFIESHIRRITDVYGFSEIRTPIFEYTELFLRGVGDTTDIVQKEMYTFEDKGGRSLSLRPELTAGVARAFVERGLHNRPQPTKLWYIGQNFRYENPQAGRYRQHYQFGVEIFGAAGAAADAEIIALSHGLLAAIGVRDVNLNINSIGCSDCRRVYHKMLGEFISARIDSLCGLCRQRSEKNPLRILDCKNAACKELLTDAPSVTDALGSDCCVPHFEMLQQLLGVYGIPFVVNPRVVRGLDYYTRTVFEFIGADGLTVIGGGRYDGLIEQVGGPSVPGVGFGMGVERLVLLLQKQKSVVAEARVPMLFIGHVDAAGFLKGQEIAQKLRKAGIYAECEMLGRSVKAQMKYADKVKARFTLVLGESELENGVVKLKNMQNGEQEQVALDMIEAKLKD